MIKRGDFKISDKQIKVFVTGFFNSGKSTLVHKLDKKAIHVEKNLSKAYNKEKLSTTTGFDLGRLVWARPNLDNETDGVLMSKTEYLRDKDEYPGWNIIYVELKGSPGQMQFSTVRKVLAKGSDGVIFLIDGCDLANVGNALVVLEEIKAILGNYVPMRIIANKSDRSDFHGCEIISNMIGEKVYEGSGKYNIGIKNAIIEVLKIILCTSNESNISKKEAILENG
ncbi:MAG: hypothetical protein ACFFHV_11365 [Promethearchaeota archaeon]